MGFDENGIAIALEADVIGDVGAYSIYPWTCGLEPVQVVSFLPGPYKIRSYRGAVRGVATNKPPTGPYRGVGRPISTFVAERLMDMGAKALGIDPLEIRRRNLVRADEFPYRIASGIIWDKTGFVECLEAAARGRPDIEALREAAERGARGRTLFRHRPCKLCRTDRDRFANCRCAGNADQHRLGNRQDPHRFDRRDHGGVRRRLARAGAGNDACPDHRRRSRREIRGYSGCAGRQRWRPDVDRNLCQPQRGSRRRRRETCLADPAGEDQEGRLASAGGERPTTSRSMAAAPPSPAPIAR